MSGRSDLVALIGILCMTTMLALAWPGVRVARAESKGPVSEPLASSELSSQQAAPACRVPAEPDPRAAALLGGLHDRLAAEAAAADQEGIVVLNNRGYNYAAPALAPDPAILRFESASHSEP